MKGDGAPISAKSLTESFGWTSDEMQIHQDIQELNRLLFEELEDNLKDTVEKDLINDLYKGCLKTTVSIFILVKFYFCRFSVSVVEKLVKEM